MFAATWATGEVFLVTMYFFLFLLWIWLIIRIAIDLFSRRDVSGLGKALWLAALIIFPIVSVLVYLIINGRGAISGSMGLAPSDAAIAKQMRAAH